MNRGWDKTKLEEAEAEQCERSIANIHRLLRENQTCSMGRVIAVP